jgi:hypothetical protein
VVQELLPRSDREQVNPVGPRHRNSLAGKAPTSPVIFRQQPPAHQRPATSAAPRRAWFPHVPRQCAGRRTGLRHGANPAPERRSAPSAQRRTDALGATCRSPRAEPAVSERAPLPSGARFPGMNRTASARLDYLQMRQQSRADTAIQAGRVMTRRQESPDRRGGDLPR